MTVFEQVDKAIYEYMMVKGGLPRRVHLPDAYFQQLLIEMNKEPECTSAEIITPYGIITVIPGNLIFMHLEE